MVEITKKTGDTSDEGSLLRLSCDACDVAIRLHPGPPIWFHDSQSGLPFGIDDLPVDGCADRTLLCRECLNDAKVIVGAGYKFVRELFRSARARLFEELCDDAVAEELHESVIAKRFVPAGGARDEREAIEDWDRHESGVLVQLYRREEEEQLAQLSTAKSLGRRKSIGLRVVKDGEPDEPF